ncbi:MAG: hypothetical protein M3253_08910 [Chloroflexota bacterium]|nr:hypothetical protein [Chloroflexota bacterium]
MSLSLFVALVLSTPLVRDGGAHMLVLGLLLALSLRFHVGLAAVIALLFVGVDLRATYIGAGYSDVGVVTLAAIERAFAGGNPYGVGYDISSPPGSPFAYGPLTLLWYLAPVNPRMVELVVSFAILTMLALRGRPLGLAIFAASPVLAQVASDGSNDTSAGLLLLIGLVTLARAPRAGAFVVGLAIAFKPYALAWAPPIVAWGGLMALLPLVLGAGLLWLPAILLWGAGSIVESFRLADATKPDPFYALGHALRRFGVNATRELLDTFRFVAGGLTTLAVLPAVRSHRAVVIGGTLIFVATLYSGWWATFAYLAAIAPVVCWYVDEWLGWSGRVRWPTDPWATMTAAVDRRWPLRQPGAPDAAADEPSPTEPSPTERSDQPDVESNDQRRKP